ncbi:MAG: hypothetical protein AB1798_14510 [Spirochaetota bacterium]
MTIKETVHKIIETLPDNIDFEDVIHALYVNSKFAHGENEIKQGKGINHAEAIKMMDSWRK